MLAGRLGLEGANMPQTDRHGVLWLANAKLTVAEGCVAVDTAGFADLPAGQYRVPFQAISALLLEPGTVVTHDVLRLAGRHGVLIAAVGEGGVRLYTAPPLRPDSSDLARRQARLWADEDTRAHVARRMYAWRFDAVLPSRDITVLRGIEGARAKETYALLAKRHGVPWKGRRFDRADPEGGDVPNQCINHAATAIYAAAGLAVTLAGAIPQLGFIHEDSGEAFALDIADLFRDSVTLPVAFTAAKRCLASGEATERVTRRLCVEAFRKRDLVATMIDRIQAVFDVDRDHDS
jgi:CRISPR-associated protein Cas1